MSKRWKKVIATLLATAMVVPTVLQGAGTLTVNAAEKDSAGVTMADLSDNETAAPSPWGILPNKNQYDYQKEELAAFCHFGMNTYTGSEWGSGTESESLFQLKNDFDAETMVSALNDAGFKKLIVTAKHHDGFCIWPSEWTTHDTETSGYKGDVLAELSAACTKYGLDMGLYLSPWDENADSYGYYDANGNALCDNSGNPKDGMTWEQVYEKDAKDYNEYYDNQLEEILGNSKYGRDGHFTEVWMDGAKGGGASAQNYDFDRWFATIQRNEGEAAGYQADAMLFGAEGHTTVRWIGNENGYANEETWSKSKVNKENNTIDSNSQGGFTVGYPDGNQWTVPECDARITSGWFWGSSKSTPKSLNDLATMYFKSVGHNGTLLLNVPPNKEGTIDQAILERVKEFGDNIKETFAKNLAAASSSTISASAVRGNSTKFSPTNVVDGKDDTYWTMDDGSKTGSITIDLGSTKTFDVVSIEEAIELGQRISSFNVQYQNQGGEWKEFAEGTTIGAKRLCRSTPVKADKVRINITGSYDVPLINEVGIYKASEGFALGQSLPDGLTMIDNTKKYTAGTGNVGFEYTGWTQETGAQYTNETNMWANAGAEFTVHFKGTKAWIIGTQDTGHGTAEIYLDGTLVETINTQSAVRAVGQQLYVTPDGLSDGDHTLRLVVKTKAIGVEAAVALDNGGAGMFEIENTTYSVPEATVNTFKVKRVGGSKGEVSVLFQDNPGSAVQSDYLPTEGIKLTFADGETEKTATVETKRQPLNTGDVFFTIELVDPTGGAIVGFNNSAKVTIIDSDKLNKNDLTTLIQQTNDLQSAHYVKDSWDAMLSAKNAAQAVIDKTSPSQTEINKVYEALKAAIAALEKRDVYTQEDPFTFPSHRDETKLLEAEYFVLDPVATNKYVRVADRDWASNGKIIDWFEEGNKIVLNYTAEKAGTYTVKAFYRSGTPVTKPNAFVWSGAKIESGSMDVYGEASVSVTHTADLNVKVTEAGAGTLIFTADSKAGPQIDKFEITPNEIDIVEYTVSASAGEGGAISDAGDTKLEEGMSKTYTITPDKGYAVKDVLVNGTSVGAVSTYEVKDISQNVTIEAKFEFSNYTAEHPFTLPNDGTQKLVEAEHFTLYPIATDKYVRITESSAASNGKEVNWFEIGNVIKLPYVAEKAGTYIFKATYRSGAIQSVPNAFAWSGENITSGSKDVYGPDANIRQTVELQIEITKAGAGELVLTASPKAGPVIDKFDVSYTGISVTGVNLDKTTAELNQLGDTVQLTATVLPENATNKNISWSSSKPSVATVSSNGLVTAAGNGTAVITVTTENGKKTAACTVTVKAPVAVTGITLDKTAVKLTETGAVQQLTANVLPADASNKNVQWSTSNQAVATVSADGLITAVSDGTAIITAATEQGGFTATCTVTVKLPVAVQGITLDKNKAALTGIGAAVQFTALVTPEDAANKNVTWSSSNNAVATVNSAGYVIAASAGTTTITATTADGGLTANAEVTVTIPSEEVAAESVTLNQSEVVLTSAEQKLQLAATVLPENASNKTVHFTSTVPSVASVEENTGLVTALANGTTDIAATVYGAGGVEITAVCKVIVAIPDADIQVTGISLNRTAAVLDAAGSTVQLTAAITPENATNKNVIWTSSNESAAAVDSSGLVSAVADGTAVITATAEDGGFTATCTVTVKIQDVKVTGVMLDRESALLESKDAQVQLNAVITPANATNKNVTWTTSNEDVAAVDANGVVTAKENGTTVITVKTEDGEFTDICTVTVMLVDPTVNVTGVTLDKTSLTFTKENTSEQLNAAVVPNNADNKEVTYSSSNTKVAKVSADGLVTPVSNGQAVITVTTKDGGKTAICKVTVKMPVKVTGISLNISSSTLKVGDSITLRAYVTPSNADNKSVTWSSSNKKVLTVSSTGKVKAVGQGSAKITATTKDGKKSAVCKITVKKAVKAPVRVAGIKISNNKTNSFAISWKKSNDADYYRVYLYNTKSNKWVRVRTTYKTSVVIKNLEPGTKYSVRVTGMNTVGKGKDSSTLYTAAKPETMKLYPVAKQSSTSVILTFNKVNRTGTIVYMKEGNGSFKKIGTTTKGSFKAKNLKKGTSYSFKVRAYTKNTGKTMYSDYSNIKTYVLK